MMMMMMVMTTGWIFEHLKKPLIFLSWKQKEGGNWARNPRVPVQVMLEKLRLDFALLNGIEEEEEIRDGGEE